MTIKMKDFGKDHWSLFAYCETRAVDYDGVLDKRHLRIKNKAVQGTSMMSSIDWKPEWGTRLSGFFLDGDDKDKSRQLPDHDDLDCFEDLENAGLIENRGTGLYPAMALTKLGFEVAKLLRTHKAEGNHFATFNPQVT